MRILSLFLTICLLVSCLPSWASAQLFPSALGGGAAQVVSQAAGEELPAQAISDDYLLGPGDELDAHLIVGDNALTLDYHFVINPQGKIFFPNISEIKLAGLTLKEARALVTKEIKKKYQENFSLSLMVTKPKKIAVFVTGQADSPGLQLVYDGTRISQLLKKVGVAKGGSNFSEFVYVKRQKENDQVETLKLNLFEVFLGSQDIPLKNKDIVAVPSIKSYVYVYGEVSRSGTYGYVPGQTLADYLNLAGGPTARASLAGTTVTRQEGGKPKVYYVNASDILQKGMISKDIEIMPGDVIYVPGNFFYFADFASFANTVLLALTLYSSLVK